VLERCRSSTWEFFGRVIENLMIFALGFIAAALIALVIIPAINARADRLARRRAAALFPLSITELTAEKDHLRAEFAVLQRKLERKAEEALAYKHDAMEELGRRAVQIEALESALAERGKYLEAIESDLGEAKLRLAQAEEEVAAANASLAAARETLTVVEDAHRLTLDELAASRSEVERTNTLLVAVRAELANTQDKLAVREAAYSALETAHTTALTDLDTKRITISDLETRLATQTARGDEFERAVSDRRGELSEERQRLADLAKNLAAEQERGLLLDQRLRELERERNEKAEEAADLAARLAAISSAPGEPKPDLSPTDEAFLVAERKLSEARTRIAALEAVQSGDEQHAGELRTLSDRYEIMKAEKSALHGALTQAREEQARLASEIKFLRARQEETSSEDLRAENAELRRRIEEVADEIMRSADAPPGAGSAPGKRIGSRRRATTPTPS
jgi:chromosome segregation ATPase